MMLFYSFPTRVNPGDVDDLPMLLSLRLSGLSSIFVQCDKRVQPVIMRIL